MSDTVDATFYVQIEAQRSPYGPVGVDGLRSVNGAKAARITRKYPEVRVPDAVVVKLTVRLPIGAFEPLRPEAVIIVPADLIERPGLVEVTADDPGAES